MTGKNSATNAGVTLSAMAVTKALGNTTKGTIVGLVVQPAVWAATGSGPDAGDAVIYGIGVAGSFGSAVMAAPGIVAGTVKALVDDSTQTLVDKAKLLEPKQVRKGISSVGDFSFFARGGHFTATKIASMGGVAWETKDGVFVYIQDAKKRLVCDYRPKKYKNIYAPLLPLQPVGNGFAWRRIRG